MQSSPAPPEATKPPQSRFTDSRGWRIAKIIGSWGLAILIALTIKTYAFQSFEVFGQSMEPTLGEGNLLLVSKLGKTFSDLKHATYVPARGEIIVIDDSLNGSRLVKRVIGLPGERVVIANGDVKIYNQAHPDGFDPYKELGLPTRFTDGQLTTLVPQDAVFVIGDNRQPGGSLDSRSELGPIPTEHIIGKLILRLWPLSQPKHH